MFTHIRKLPFYANDCSVPFLHGGDVVCSVHGGDVVCSMHGGDVVPGLLFVDDTVLVASDEGILRNSLDS